MAKALDVRIQYQGGSLDLDDVVCALAGKTRLDFDGGAGMGVRDLDSNFVVTPAEAGEITRKIYEAEFPEGVNVRVLFFPHWKRRSDGRES